MFPLTISPQDVSAIRRRVSRINALSRRRRQRGEIITWEAIVQRFGAIGNWRCALCYTGYDLTVDHIIPFVGGGHHVACNLQILCRPCNSKKGCNERRERKVVAGW